MPAAPGLREKQKTRKMLEKKRKEFKGDPRIKMKPGSLPKAKADSNKPAKPNIRPNQLPRNKTKQIKVRKGDNLTHIADRNGTNVNVLKMMNPGIKPRKMPVGMILNVPSLRTKFKK